MQKLTGQTALVTGAGSGIGRGIALVLASEGARIAVVDLDHERGATSASAVRDRGGEAIGIAADVSVAGDVARAVAEAVEWSGRLDIVASDAGIYPPAARQALDESTSDRVMAVNVRSAFLLVKAAVPLMRRQQYGRVVVTASITGSVTAVPGLAHYAASKAALLGLVRGAALEVARDGVTINAVLPGTSRRKGHGQRGHGVLRVDAPVHPARPLRAPRRHRTDDQDAGGTRSELHHRHRADVDGGQSLPGGGLQRWRCLEPMFAERKTSRP